MNPRINYVIIDDEKNSREVLKKLLGPYNFLNFVGEASNSDTGYELIKSKNPQLIFLDIQMPGGDGFSLLSKFGNEIEFETIFITSFDQYAINAIKANAADYLLKPVDLEELENSLEKIRKKILNKKSPSQSKSSKMKFTVHYGDKVKLIEESDIMYIEADGRYSNIYTNECQKYTTPRNIKDFENNFGDKSSFIRISKTYMVNADYIKEYSKGEPFVIKMNNSTTFEVARRKKAEVLEKLKG